MKLKNNRSGFTLLEIIIVIIIVGVLASLALPRLFNTIEYSRSTEALNSLGIIKRAADRCEMAEEAVSGATDNFLLCDTFPELGIDDPSYNAANNPSAIFQYVITDPYLTPNFVVVATRVQGSQSAVSAAVGDTITFTYNTQAGTVSRAGDAAGAYSALK